jgi:hypothetical protein
MADPNLGYSSVRSRTLAKLGQNWQEILKKVQTDM